MAKRLKVPISTARARLFQLTDIVRQSGDDTVLVLEQRGHTDPVALVREARLAYLEERVMQLDRQQDEPFTVAGSLASDLDDESLEAALREIRKDWTPRTPVEQAHPRARKPRPRGR